MGGGGVEGGMAGDRGNTQIGLHTKMSGQTKRDCDVVDFMSISLMTGEAVH